MGTPTYPPDAPPFADLVRRYDQLVYRSALRWGVRAADVSDCAQEVLLRFYRAIVDRRLDASRPTGLGGWLKKTTRTVARDLLALDSTRNEILTKTGVLDRMADPHDQEDLMAESIDVPEVIDRILDKLPREQREVYVLSDLEDMPMDEILEELEIPRSTAYDRLKAARAAVAREWNAMRASGVVVAPLALLSVHELIAAEHSTADVPQSVTDELLRRLGEELGQDFIGSASGAVAAGIGARLGAAAGAARASAVMLTTWQIGLGALLVGITAAGLTAALRPADAAHARPTTVTLHAPSPATPAPPPALDPPPLPPGGAPASVTASAPSAPSEIQTRLLDNARALLGNRQPAKALALLARVTAPELADERDGLRRLGLAQLPDAGQP